MLSKASASTLQWNILCAYPLPKVFFGENNNQLHGQMSHFILILVWEAALIHRTIKKKFQLFRFTFFCKQVAQRMPIMYLMANIHIMGLQPSVCGKNIKKISRAIHCNGRGGGRGRDRRREQTKTLYSTISSHRYIEMILQFSKKENKRK